MVWLILRIIKKVCGKYLTLRKKWKFKPTVQAGDTVESGDVIGEVEETTLLTHKIMIPPGMSGTIKQITGGEFTVVETVAVLTGADGIHLGNDQSGNGLYYFIFHYILPCNFSSVQFI